LPGVSKENLSIHFDKGHLTLEGRLGEFAPDEEPFDYRRTFVVPQGIDSEKISAQLQSGVLRVSLPKPAALRPRQIEVRAS
jgi:HSP20 family molecular chaperone IbpA